MSLLILLLAAGAQAETDYHDLQPRPFFSAQDTQNFAVDDGSPLQRVLAEGLAFYMTQDGNIYEADVATVEPPVKQARQSDYSFDRSKYQLATQVYTDYDTAFYSGCRFRTYQKKLVPVLSSCGYKPRKNANRAKRIEWEHIVPAWVFGNQLQCWQQGGRANCRSKSARFRQMEADMHNLVPAIGEINGDRNNYRFQMIAGEERPYGQAVNMEIDFGLRQAEPPDNVYGDIARTYFYMRDKYGLQMSDAQQQLMRAWNNMDPVDAWEKKRNQRITELQGNDNPFVTHYQRIDESVPSGKNQQASDLDMVDEFYRLVYAYKDNMPYALFSLLTLLYLAYLKFRRKPKPTADKKESS